MRTIWARIESTLHTDGYVLMKIMGNLHTLRARALRKEWFICMRFIQIARALYWIHCEQFILHSEDWFNFLLHINLVSSSVVVKKMLLGMTTRRGCSIFCILQATFKLATICKNSISRKALFTLFEHYLSSGVHIWRDIFFSKYRHAF